MASITDIVQSSGWKSFMAKLYGLGASVVIIGALFKIQHWKFAGAMLTLGLLTESVIFFFSAFEPLHEELDWTLVYPELAGMSDPDEIENFKENQLEGNRSIERIENLLGDANVNEEVLKNLGDGLKKLQETAVSMADISMATTATKDFVGHMQTAAGSIDQMNASYSSTQETIKQSATSLANAYLQSADVVKKSGSEVANTYASIAETIKNDNKNLIDGGKVYETHLESLNKNLSALNAVYELQIKDGSDHLKGSQKIFGGLEDMIKRLNESVDETNKYKDEITKLRDNLSSLNTIYGNMLSAMNVMIK